MASPFANPRGQPPVSSPGWAARLRGFMLPAVRTDLAPPGMSAGFGQAREQLLTLIMRAAAVFGVVALLASSGALIEARLFWVLMIQAGILGLIWLLAICRGIAYQVRGGMLLASLYLLSINELLHFGYSEDASAFFIGLSLLAVLFFNRRAGYVALLLSIASLGGVGALIATGQFVPFAQFSRPLSVGALVPSCTTFLLVAGTIQIGITSLFQHLQVAWQHEHDLRTGLEQRVAERTSQLARAHAQAEDARRQETVQKEYLGVLHQTALDLLNRRDLDDLLRAIVDRATGILDAPYGELLVRAGDELVVQAFSGSRPFLAGGRVVRGEAQLAWQAYDTQLPVIVGDYPAWQAQHTPGAEQAMCAVAHFPILAGGQCLGVLALGRDAPGRPFEAEEVHKGEAFSNLAALVLDNASLYSTALREIADRKQAERVLQHYAAELQTHNAELDAFAHTVAHDLKNPLGSLLGFNQLLQTGYERLNPAVARGILDDVAQIGAKMDTIIDGLLLLASTRGQAVPPADVLSMETIVAELDVRFYQALSEAGATIAKPESWPPALGYAPWVEEVWANYLSNALKYGGSPPEITLGATPAENGFVRFWMRDNGPGLSAEQQARLFTPFTRLHTRRGEGHGLGLSIVQQIVSKLGGSAGVESAPGAGSTFYFTLPAPYSLAE